MSRHGFRMLLVYAVFGLLALPIVYFAVSDFVLLNSIQLTR